MAESRSVDVAVVGAGPAGLAAAVQAADAGASVLVVDQSPGLGGQIWRHRAGAPVPRNAARLLHAFARSDAEYIGGATVVDAEQGRLALATSESAVHVRARTIVLATGARELFLPFPGWTLPNVFGVGGLQALIKSGLDVRGRRVVIAGTGPLLLPVAASAVQHGARVEAVAEQTPRRRMIAFAAGLWRSPGKLALAARYRTSFLGTRLRAGTWIVRAEGARVVERAVLTDGRREWVVPCDLVGAACGLIPNVEVGIAIGCRATSSGIAVDAGQQTTVSGVFAAGECTGIGGEELALVEGAIAGRAAAGRDAAAWYARRNRLRAFAARLDAAFALRPELLLRADAQTVVCRCEDVRLGALDRDWGARQGKLATRAGMGACQGRVCGAALERMFAWEAPVLRPPLAPVTAAVLRDLDGPA